MSRLIIISNRAPISITEKNGELVYTRSSGGLATGLSSFAERMKKRNSRYELIWIGWPGREVKNERKVHKEIMNRFGVHSIFFTEEEMMNFYEGFCNKTIWPLFHYFPSITMYEESFWDEYVSVNRAYCDEIMKIIRPGDMIWVHDYHLMLLPGMIRSLVKDATIGFFLHIPFPSYEVFRLLPSDWRKQILEGLYGADLIGFHTFDYRTYFLRSTLNILGLTDHMGEVVYDQRMVKVDSFPMGIDFEKFHSNAMKKSVAKSTLQKRKNAAKVKYMLSIDRQDYTKGILNRLKAYEHFLLTYPQWRKKIMLLLIVIPSRIALDSYKNIKDQVDHLVGRINGTYGDLDWTPINYQYRSIPFTELIALYNICDVALITPLRDGMNLIAKEYIACRTNKKGILILSEMTGAAEELHDAIIINPNNVAEISKSMNDALLMDDREQATRLKIMQHRVKSYSVVHWADDFMNSLQGIKGKQERLRAKSLSKSLIDKITDQFAEAAHRLIFLDYDGTLVAHSPDIHEVSPDARLLKILDQLSQIPNTTVVLISGRDKFTLGNWFAGININFVAEHGVFVKEVGKNWRLFKPIRNYWKKRLIPVLNQYTEKLPGSFVEIKEYSVAYHYRQSDQSFAELRIKELMSHLSSLTANMDVQIVQGSKVLELRNAGIDKGVAALHWVSASKSPDRFILAIGNDVTDEDLFRSMPSDAYSVLVGNHPSYAKFNLENHFEARKLLEMLVDNVEVEK